MFARNHQTQIKWIVMVLNIHSFRVDRSDSDFMLPFSNINYLQSYLIPPKYPLCANTSIESMEIEKTSKAPKIEFSCWVCMQREICRRKSKMTMSKWNFFALSISHNVHENFFKQKNKISIHTIKHNFFNKPKKLWIFSEEEIFQLNEHKEKQKSKFIISCTFENYIERVWMDFWSKAHWSQFSLRHCHSNGLKRSGNGYSLLMIEKGFEMSFWIP
jgi:hypothetical protein